MAGLPGDLREGVHVRLQPLVALGDAREALDGAAVEPGAVLERALQLVERDRDALDDAHDVRELELDEADVVLLRRVDLGEGFSVRCDLDDQCPSPFGLRAARRRMWRAAQARVAILRRVPRRSESAGSWFESSARRSRFGVAAVAASGRNGAHSGRRVAAERRRARLDPADARATRPDAAVQLTGGPRFVPRARPAAPGTRAARPRSGRRASPAGGGRRRSVPRRGGAGSRTSAPGR